MDQEIIIDGKVKSFDFRKRSQQTSLGGFSIDVVVESTGLFTSYEKRNFILIGVRKKVVISAPH